MTTDYRAIIIAEQQHRDALRADWVKAGMSPQAAAADAQTWANLALWVEDKTLVTPDWPLWASTTRRAARAAMKAHVADLANPIDLTDPIKAERANNLTRLARHIAIFASQRGVEDAIPKFLFALDLAGTDA